MIALFYARCTKTVEGLIKGNRYLVSEVNGNSFTLENIQGSFDQSFFEVENAYFSIGKALPEIDKPLKNIVRFNGSNWEKIIETSPVEEIALLNENTFLVFSNHGSYVYQIPNKQIKLSPLFTYLLPFTLAIGKDIPNEGVALSKIVYLDKDNSWKSLENTVELTSCGMLSKNSYLIISGNNMCMYVLK